MAKSFSWHNVIFYHSTFAFSMAFVSLEHIEHFVFCPFIYSYLFTWVWPYKIIKMSVLGVCILANILHIVERQPRRAGRDRYLMPYLLEGINTQSKKLFRQFTCLLYVKFPRNIRTCFKFLFSYSNVTKAHFEEGGKTKR